MPLRDRIASFARLFRERPRKTSSADGLTFIEFREIGVAQLETFNDAVQEKVAALPGVIWVEVNPHTRRVIVSHDPYRVSAQELVDAIVDDVDSFRNQAEQPDDLTLLVTKAV